eukprot:TRINITY_DN5804_c0_g1_i2.p2 TRINITY_DN5804_c0_g1~~TRINITY_DN5804_c0_g1_i2.p2  ORF type:complete len:156 (+),score=38.49 TRINITY_DN5804_c0_g1_i2:108-575(+)
MVLPFTFIASLPSRKYSAELRESLVTFVKTIGGQVDSLEDALAERRDEHLCKAVDDSNDGDCKEQDPPEPQNEEKVLVEEVVGKNAENAGPVITPTTNRARAVIASNFCWEKVAHWIGISFLCSTVIVLLYISAIFPETSIKKTIHNLETGKQHD